MQTLSVVLEHTLRDLVFYSVGIIINISLHGKGEQIGKKLLKEDYQCVSNLIEVLKDANLEDLDLARVAAKALHNLQKVPDSGKFWSESNIAHLDELTV